MEQGDGTVEAGADSFRAGSRKVDGADLFGCQRMMMLVVTPSQRRNKDYRTQKTG
jgi:hypothetical protein